MGDLNLKPKSCITYHEEDFSQLNSVHCAQTVYIRLHPLYPIRLRKALEVSPKYNYGLLSIFAVFVLLNKQINSLKM